MILNDRHRSIMDDGGLVPEKKACVGKSSDCRMAVFRTTPMVFGDHFDLKGFFPLVLAYGISVFTSVIRLSSASMDLDFVPGRMSNLCREDVHFSYVPHWIFVTFYILDFCNVFSVIIKPLDLLTCK